MRSPVRDELLPHAEAGRDEMVLGFHYMRAVARAGGLPVVMAPGDGAGAVELVERIDGLLLPGGPDIEPAAYGQEPDPQLGPTWPEVDRFEIAVERAAAARGIPVLAICRGMQLLNVARGGTLFQHLPDHVGDDVVHRRAKLDDPVAEHPVRVEPGSLLARSLGREEAVVNSYHHQAPDRVAESLRAVAFAPDGVVEGLEDPDAEFVLGVQWHAEAMQDHAEQAALFDAYVAAAGG
jgi:putative glutamine amidotransferase